MRRTQIYLAEEELDLLNRMEEVTGASRSELIRRAIRESYGRGSKVDRLEALRISAGSWKGRTRSGAEYVDEIREDFSERLDLLGK